MANKRFKYEIKLFKLHIPNSKEEIFKNEVMNIPYLLYEVEELSNENKIVINKPGGKRNFGRLSRNDLMVFIYYTKEKELWLISHKEIENDLINKSKLVLLYKAASLVINLKSREANSSSSIRLSTNSNSFKSLILLTTLHLLKESHIAFSLVAIFTI